MQLPTKYLQSYRHSYIYRLIYILLPGKTRVVVNVAQSLNGFISGASGRRVLISSPEDMQRVHALRAGVDAIVVGANTITNDNPRLVVDANLVMTENQPIRVVLDRNRSIPPDSRVLDGSARTLVFTSMDSGPAGLAEVRVREEKGLRPENILSELQDEGCRSILVEGGREVITEFVLAGIVDEFYLFIGDVILEEGGLSLFLPPSEIRGVIREASSLGKGVLISLDPDYLRRSWRTQAKVI